MKNIVNRHVLGNRIRELRKRAGLTQEELAIFSEVSSNYISMLERGTSSLNVNNLLQIAKALRVTPNDILIDHFDAPLSKQETEYETVIRHFDEYQSQLFSEIVRSIKYAQSSKGHDFITSLLGEEKRE